MTLKEAIEGSQEAATFLGIHNQPRLRKSIQLLIEAGKLTEGLRAGLPRDIIRLLPGETEE